MPDIDEKQKIQATDVDRVREAGRSDRDHEDLESIFAGACLDGRLLELIEIALDGLGHHDLSDISVKPNPKLQAAIEAYHNYDESQGGDMDTDVRPSKKGRPQTITREYAGKWIAWSEDGMRIVAVGESFEDCERATEAVGIPANLAGILWVPRGRSFRDED